MQPFRKIGCQLKHTNQDIDMRKIILSVIIPIVFAVVLFSCIKPVPTEPLKRVRYEMTGTFTGKFKIIYNDNVNGNTERNNDSLPWSKELTYQPNVIGIDIGAQSSIAGLPGQNVALKIFVNGAEVKSSSATASSTGEITLPKLLYNF
jgi:hypothetical protein